MKHYNYDEWLQYVRNESSEKTREELESHLYTCDQCLDLYLQAMATNESSLPILSNDVSFTELVMGEVSKIETVVPDTSLEVKVNHRQMKTANFKKPFYQQVVFHYLLAAVATILLTFSGVFHSLATYTGTVESPYFQKKSPSVTDSIINKTFAWMDSLENKGGR